MTDRLRLEESPFDEMTPGEFMMIFGRMVLATHLPRESKDAWLDAPELDRFEVGLLTIWGPDECPEHAAARSDNCPPCAARRAWDDWYGGSDATYEAPSAHRVHDFWARRWDSRHGNWHEVHHASPPSDFGGDTYDPRYALSALLDGGGEKMLDFVEADSQEFEFEDMALEPEGPYVSIRTYAIPSRDLLVEALRDADQRCRDAYAARVQARA